MILLDAVNTLPGNFFNIGAASVVINVEQTEQFGARPIMFWQFTQLVLPVTLVTVTLSHGWVGYVLPTIITKLQMSFASVYGNMK